MEKEPQSKMAEPQLQKSKTRKTHELTSIELTTLSAILLLLPLFIQAILTGHLRDYVPTQLQATIPSAQPDNNAAIDPSSPALLQACKTHTYTTEIISLSPLMIYINNFTSTAEARALIDLGTPDFAESFISRRGGGVEKDPGRTSTSAPLELDHPLVECILARARTFLGTMLQPTEPISVPQLVRYHRNQRYDVHTDFWPRHQRMKDGSGRLFNRPASFFVFLRGNCTGGETYFPMVDVLERDRVGGLEGLFGGKVRSGGPGGRGMEGGVRFAPVEGSAVFWVNLNGEEGVGDRRVVHAGLPVEDGEKIGMNIWPRKFYAEYEGEDEDE